MYSIRGDLSWMYLIDCKSLLVYVKYAGLNV